MTKKPVRESGLLEALRVPLTPCRNKKNKETVCCESNKKERLVKKKRQEIEFQEYEYFDDTDYFELEENEDLYYYDEEMDYKDYYEEDYDVIFDKVTVFSHVNAPGGR